MTTTKPKQKLTFEQFLEYDIEEERRYELVNRVEVVRLVS